MRKYKRKIKFCSICHAILWNFHTHIQTALLITFRIIFLCTTISETYERKYHSLFSEKHFWNRIIHVTVFRVLFGVNFSN